MNPNIKGLSRKQRVIKRVFDIFVSLLGLFLTLPIILLAILMATLDTRKNGLFRQIRIGLHGKPFWMFKIRSMRDMDSHLKTSVTTSRDPRITVIGKLLRRSKLDELPQLWNVLVGQMSLVGPRPDVRGFADRLSGEDRIILSVRPGIIGPGTLKYVFEEELLAKQEDPEAYNRAVIFPDKVALNRQYVTEYSFKSDLNYLLQTFVRLKYHKQ